MDVRRKKVDGLLTVSVFVIILIVGLGVSFKQAFFSGKQYVWDMIHGNYDVAANKFEESYNTVFSGTNLSRNVFSFTQRLLGKHEARNFEVLKGNDGTLYLQNASWPTDEKTIEEIADQYMLLKKETENYGGHFMYVQVPYKTVEGVANLKYYSDDTTNQAESTFVNFLKERDVPILDLRDYTTTSLLHMKILFLDLLVLKLALILLAKMILYYISHCLIQIWNCSIIYMVN